MLKLNKYAQFVYNTNNLTSEYKVLFDKWYKVDYNLSIVRNKLQEMVEWENKKTKKLKIKWIMHLYHMK